MNLIELRDNLNCFINAGHGKKKVGIAQVIRSDYDEVGGLDVTNDFTTILICAWDTTPRLIAKHRELT